MGRLLEREHAGESAMKFICLGFFNESKWERLSEQERQSMMEDCLEFDDELRRGGHFLGGEALDSAHNAVTLQRKNGRVEATDGPFTETKEVLGGILLLEARDLNHAIALMSKHPGSQIGPWEIRAANEEINAMVAERGAAVEAERPSQLDETSHSSATLRESLVFSYEWIKPLADDLADAPMTSPTPQSGNHPLWIMGHLAFSSAGLLEMISGNPNPYQNWKELFAGGSQPQSDAASYPPYSEVIEAYHATHQTALALLAATSEEQLSQRPPAVWEALRDDPSFQSIGRVFLFIAMHEMSHRGQLADARRALGRKPFA